MFHKYKYIFLVLFLFKANTSLAQSVSSNVIIISSPEKTVAASAQSGANTLQVINSYGLGLASTINLSWLSLALGLAVASVWDGDSGGNNSTSTSTRGYCVDSFFPYFSRQPCFLCKMKPSCDSFYSQQD